MSTVVSGAMIAHEFFDEFLGREARKGVPEERIWVMAWTDFGRARMYRGRTIGLRESPGAPDAFRLRYNNMAPVR
jgi:hypothetical protein